MKNKKSKKYIYLFSDTIYVRRNEERETWKRSPLLVCKDTSSPNRLCEWVMWGVRTTCDLCVSAVRMQTQKMCRMRPYTYCECESHFHMPRGAQCTTQNASATLWEYELAFPSKALVEIIRNRMIIADRYTTSSFISNLRNIHNEGKCSDPSDYPWNEYIRNFWSG